MKNKAKWIVRVISLLVFICFIVLTYQWLDISQLTNTVIKLVKEPFWIIIITLFYMMAFYLRAWAWWQYLGKKLPFFKCLDGLWYSLFVNHLVPFKAGELVRMKVATESQKVSWDEAAHSVVVLRALDLGILIILSGLGAFYFIGQLHVNLPIFLVAVLLVALIIGFYLRYRFPAFFKKHLNMFRQVFTHKKGLWILVAVSFSWVCEGVVIYGISMYFSSTISYIQSIWINSITVGGSIFQIAPGGIGTYQSAMTGALYILDISLNEAYHMAIISHGYKFIFSYIVGFIVMIKSPIKLNLRELSRKGVR